MPIGSDTPVLETLPGQPYASDPAKFTQLTRPNVAPFSTVAFPGAGGVVRAQVAQVGVLSRVRATLRASITVDTGGVTALQPWPHGILKSVLMSVNGQDKLFACNGVDLHVLRFARNPALEEGTDVHPGTAGAGSTIAAGTYDIEIAWEIPVAMDDTSLVGALYAQSSATVIALELTMASLADLFADTTKITAWTGTFTFEHKFFSVPRAPEGPLVVPDLSRMHAFVALDVPITAAGEAPAPLIRSAGQLTRLFLQARKSTTAYLSAAPVTAAASRIDSLRLEYGGNERPFVFNPASSLVRQNNRDYGGILPYGYVALDFVRDNPTRDALLLQGVTELKAILGLNSAVSPSTGAQIHLVQETLY